MILEGIYPLTYILNVASSEKNSLEAQKIHMLFEAIFKYLMKVLPLAKEKLGADKTILIILWTNLNIWHKFWPPAKHSISRRFIWFDVYSEIWYSLGKIYIFYCTYFILKHRLYKMHYNLYIWNVDKCIPIYDSVDKLFQVHYPEKWYWINKSNKHTSLSYLVLFTPFILQYFCVSPIANTQL